MADYKINNFYQGGYSAFAPMPSSSYFKTETFSTVTDPRSANIVKEVSDKLSAGVKSIEIAGVIKDVFDSIPQEQFKEVKRLAKLTGIDVSMHGPVLDVSGIGQQGFSEQERESSERRILQTLERSHDINPTGNIPVNFHSAEGIPGSEFEVTEDGQKFKKMVAINKEDGRMMPLESETRFYPGAGPGGAVHTETTDAKENLRITNTSQWDNNISQIFFNKERADEILQKNKAAFQPFSQDWANGTLRPQDLGPTEQQVLTNLRDVQLYLGDINKQINTLFSRAYKYGTEDQKEKLDQISKEYANAIGAEEVGENKMPRVDTFQQSNAMTELLLKLRDPKLAPEVHVPVEQFAVDQSKKTFGNAAYAAYKKFGDSAPILNIENPPAGFALSRGQDVRRLVEASREQFIANAVNDGMSQSEARAAAEKTIGATLDVGHMNMLRKQGFSEEDVVKESAEMAPVLKHIHLSDNFGFEHTELPMGMGNVPTQKIMSELKRQGAKPEEMKKVIEAAQWWQHFKTSPFQSTLENFGSPMSTTRVTPYWNQAPSFSQDYSEGFGLMLPQVNYETFGGGFSQLPTDLGGQRPGAGGSRMSGRPME